MKSIQKRRKRAIFTKILFVGVAFLAMGILSYFFIGGIIRDSMVRSADSVLDFAEMRIEKSARKAASTLDGFAEGTRQMIMRGDGAEELDLYIDALFYYTNVIGETVINIDGYYGYFETLGGEPVLLHRHDMVHCGMSAAELDPMKWYAAAVEANGGIVEMRPFQDEENGLFVTYAKSIYDDQGNRLGVVGLDLQINDIADEVVHMALNQGDYGMLLDQEYLILTHPNADLIGLYADNPAVPLSTLIPDAKKGNPIFEQKVLSYLGEPAVAFFRTLSNGWQVGLVSPEAQYYKGTSSMAGILCLLGVSLAAALCILLIRVDSERMRSDEESRQKSAFLANMSHEIRTPINAIVGMTALGQSANNTERKDYCFGKIKDASSHLLGVINDILDISKIEANKIELSAVTFRFEKMLQQVVGVINFRVEEKNQKLTVHIDKAIPKVLIADNQRFAQVVTNLLSNAVKFTPENGAVCLKATLVNEQGRKNSDDPSCVIKIEVTDTGIGLTPEQRAKLFRSFQQAEQNTTRKYGGTGLGLAISKGIVELMGGEIWADSEIGRGSTFGFTVRVLRGLDDIYEPEKQGVDWNNIQLLAVDDDLDVLEYFREIVLSLGAMCDIATNAADALALIEKNGDYNIYFVDLKMPDVDGIQLTRKIRGKEKIPGTSVVIMISSYDFNAIESEAKDAGVDKFIVKPLFPSTVADAISECIGVNQRIEEMPEDIDGIFAGKRVLLAEDIEVNREIVLAMLEPTGVHIDCAENGREAVRLFLETPDKYDMIYMDIQMPEMDGLEATRLIRAVELKKAKTVPIVAMTANAFKEDVDACISAGMNNHLAKPIDTDMLLTMTRRYLLGQS